MPGHLVHEAIRLGATTARGRCYRALAERHARIGSIALPGMYRVVEALIEESRLPDTNVDVLYDLATALMGQQPDGVDFFESWPKAVEMMYGRPYSAVRRELIA